MSKQPSLNFKDIEKLLLKNGFELDRIKGSHHIFYNQETKRRVTVPKHRKDLPKGTLQSILKQAGIKLE